MSKLRFDPSVVYCSPGAILTMFGLHLLFYRPTTLLLKELYFFLYIEPNGFYFNPFLIYFHFFEAFFLV